MAEIPKESCVRILAVIWFYGTATLMTYHLRLRFFGIIETSKADLQATCCQVE